MPTRPTEPPAPRTAIFGVLGGIASGKSAVARLLAGPRGRVIDADALAREALASPSLSSRLSEHFGPACLGPDGQPDREALAHRVFSSEEDRRLLESWIHPLVRERILSGLAEARALGLERVALDVPLLLENDDHHHLVGLCDVLVFVDADDEQRDRRAVQTRGWSAGEVARREAAQMPLDRKRERADFVITNNATLEELEQAVDRILVATGHA